MKKSVTLEGDSFDPAGTLSGGSRPQSSSLLTALSQFSQVDKQISEQKERLDELSKQLSHLNKVTTYHLYLITPAN